MRATKYLRYLRSIFILSINILIYLKVKKYIEFNVFFNLNTREHIAEKTKDEYWKSNYLL